MSRRIGYIVDGDLLDWIVKVKLEYGLSSWTDTLNVIVTEHKRFKNTSMSVEKVLEKLGKVS